MESTGQTTDRPVVLVVSASVGAGHNQAARAITDALRAEMPHVDAEWIDLLTLTPRLFRAYYAGGYALAVTKLPFFYGLAFWLTNRPNGPKRGLDERRRLWSERLAMRKFTRFLQERRPALIINTHFLGAPLIARLIDSGQLRTRQMVVVTDTLAHRFWYSQTVERYFLSGETSLPTFERWGVDPDRITVSGMPVHSRWRRALDREQVLSQWQLPRDRHIVLVTGGAAFTCGPIVAIARGVAQACPTAHVVVLVGRNKKLLGRLTALGECPDRLRAVPFTHRADELVDVASLMITKAGGSTAAECVAKGTPMVLLKPVPGQELANAKYYAARGAGVMTRNTREVIAQTKRLLADAEALGKLADAARQAWRPATDTIVQAAREVLSEAPPS